MSQDVFKAPKNKGMKRLHKKERNDVGWSPGWKRKNNFLSFCDIVLAYTRYEQMKQEDIRMQNNTSPLDSSGSTADSFTSESGGSGLSYMTEDDGPARAALMASSVAATVGTGGDEDSLDSITCFCLKPFAGRPMIECCKCLTWIHLSCAKIRQSNIPDEFICQKCRESKANKRKSGRMKSEKKKIRMGKSSPSQSSPSYHHSATSSSFTAQLPQAILTS